jgi:hypothetical protein
VLGIWYLVLVLVLRIVEVLSVRCGDVLVKTFEC